MYLAAVHVTLDLEPEVAQVDRERVLRSVRDKLKSVYGHRVTVRTDDESAVVVAFLDDNFERARTRADEVGETVDGTGQARVSQAHTQIFAWFEGCFQETGARASQTPLPLQEGRTVVYRNRDEDDEDDALPSLTSRATRRNLRIPTRK